MWSCGDEHTWHDIARVHRVFVLDEAEAIHQLDLGDLTRAMGVEMVLNIGLCSCSAPVQSANPSSNSKTSSLNGAWLQYRQQRALGLDLRTWQGRATAGKRAQGKASIEKRGQVQGAGGTAGNDGKGQEDARRRVHVPAPGHGIAPARSRSCAAKSVLEANAMWEDVTI